MATNPAESYERYFVPALFAPCAARLVELVQPRPGDRVLDLACGTGIVARQVVPRVTPGGTVSALDINPLMLEVARAAAQSEGAAIEFHEGNAEQLPFDDGAFELVTCQHAFQFFPDQLAVAREITRVLAPGGRVAIATWQGLDQHPFYERLHAAMTRRFGISGVGQIFSLGDADRLRSLLSSAGIEGAAVRPMSITSTFPDAAAFLAMEIDIDVAAVPSMQRISEGERAAITAELREEMEPALQVYVRDGAVTLPFEAQLTTGQRVREPAGAKSL
ncbi:MAG: methyltransferase domain-containing protein [Dehalococcoidia bacterium]